MSTEQPRTGPGPETVSLASLVLVGSPRLAGEDVRHVRLLAEASAQLPPILVHRQTMQVIDGMHRVRAASLRGEKAIEAVFFDGDAGAAFVQAVRANIAHGLPLPLADRRAAAARILSSHGDWSDRAIAAVTGLSAVSVRAIRGRATDRFEQSNTRRGRDGRVRPLDPGEGRRRAAKVLAERPGAALREVARLAGVSVSTARDVRRRFMAGEDPVPGEHRAGGRIGVPRPGPAAVAAARDARPARDARASAAILAGLQRDPSLRYSERGRTMLRWLEAHLVSTSDWSRVVDAVPANCSYPVSELAAGCARAWARLAAELRAKGTRAEQ